MYDDIDPRNLPTGTVVDGYTLTGRIGGGGMGEIYRAQRGREVFALKLQGERLTEAMDPVKREELEARSRREAAVLLSLSHPNILAIIGSGRWPDRGGYLYLITELVAGEPIDAWHQRQQPSLRQLTSVFERTADALDYMHRAGIYHRDLKDPNVLVREDGTPVVIDLGIARSAAAYTLTRVGAVIGTTTHLSPGVCRYLVGEKSHAYRFGPHDDLHALGFMLYERLTGTAPFRQRSDVEWPEFDYYRQVMEHIPTAPHLLCPVVPAVLSELTMKLLAKTPEASFRDAQQLQEELENALAHAPSTWDAPFPVPRDVQRKDLTRSGPVRLPHPDDASSGPRAVRVGAEGRGKLPPPPPQSALDSSLVQGRASPRNTERAIAALRTPPPEAAPASPEADFHPPTTEVLAGFISLDEDMPQPVPQPPNALSATGLQKVAEQLRPPARPARRFGTLALVFLGAGVLVLLGILVKSIAEHSRPQPKSLLQRYQEELATETASSASAGRSAELSTVPALPSQGSPALRESASATDTPPPVGARTLGAPPSPPSASDAKAIQAELERAYGSRRPTLPAKATAAATGMPSWVKGVEVVDAKPNTGEKKLGGRYGDHLRLQLRSNLDSRLCGSGTVEAVLIRPYLVNNETVLPVRTLVYGQCAAQQQRFLVAFNRLRLPNGTEVHFDGVALDVADGKPGLLATRRLTGGSAAQEGVGTSVARGAASTVLGTATAGGGLGATLASGAGQTALGAAAILPSSSGSEEAILLDEGGDIDVFVRQSF